MKLGTRWAIDRMVANEVEAALRDKMPKYKHRSGMIEIGDDLHVKGIPPWMTLSEFIAMCHWGLNEFGDLHDEMGVGDGV